MMIVSIIGNSECDDNREDCQYFVENDCYIDDIQENCKKSCGLCPGMRPESSVECYNEYSDCESKYVDQCFNQNIKKDLTFIN